MPIVVSGTCAGAHGHADMILRSTGLAPNKTLSARVGTECTSSRLTSTIRLRVVLLRLSANIRGYTDMITSLGPQASRQTKPSLHVSGPKSPIACEVDGTIIPKQAVAISMRQSSHFHNVPPMYERPLLRWYVTTTTKADGTLRPSFWRESRMPTKRQFEFQNVRPADGTTLPSIGGTAAGPAGSSRRVQLLRAFT
jgi:hypothetical protein